jgi:hypothetical protein
VERREAPARRQKRGTDGRRQRFAALHPLFFQRDETTGDPGASTKNSGDDARVTPKSGNRFSDKVTRKQKWLFDN